jgi:hypothetical protein
MGDSGNSGNDDQSKLTGTQVPDSFERLTIPAAARRKRRSIAGKTLLYASGALVLAAGGATAQYAANSMGYNTPIDVIAEALSGSEIDSNQSKTTDQSNQLPAGLEKISGDNSSYQLGTEEPNVGFVPSADDLVSGYYASDYANKSIELGQNDDHTLGALADSFLESFDAYMVTNYGVVLSSDLRNEVKNSAMNAFAPAVQESGYALKDNAIVSSKGKELEKVIISLE